MVQAAELQREKEEAKVREKVDKKSKKVLFFT